MLLLFEETGALAADALSIGLLETNETSVVTTSTLFLNFSCLRDYELQLNFSSVHILELA
jgi:hypothetical protein